MSLLESEQTDGITPEQKIKAIHTVLIAITSESFISVCNDYDVAYDLLINNIIPVITSSTSGEIHMFLARFYQQRLDYDNMLKNDLIAIEKDNIDSVRFLSLYYDKKKDYDSMKKYCLIGIEQNDARCACHLGNYYYAIMDITNAIKYYLISIKIGNYPNAMINIGHSYSFIHDNNNAIKYYLMAFGYGIIEAINEVGQFYMLRGDHTNMVKYYLLAIINGNYDRLYHLYRHYKLYDIDNGISVFTKLVVKEVPGADCYLARLLHTDNDTCLKFVKTVYINMQKLEASRKEIADLKSYVTELELAPEGPKYAEAKKHFESLCTVEMT
jgi:tetratricopeptide (TPR) repeat protein